MLDFICTLFRQKKDSRDGVITAVSGAGIAVNALIAGVKVFLGLITNSIAIASEGVNNATDALTSVLALVGTKLAGKHPDEKHPFGYGRIEYLTGLVISVIILVSGIELLMSSVKLIFAPEEMTISVMSLIIVTITAFIKFLLSVWTIKIGRQTGSGALEAVGLEGRSDSFASVITVATAIVFIVFGLSLDAYAGIIISLLILKAGIDVLKNTVSDLLGRPGEKELAKQIYKEILATDGIAGAADMMLHNYGPDSYSGSVNIEIDYSKTVGEVYEVIHALQLRIMHEYKVTMVFGIYAVDEERESSRELRKTIGAFVKKTEHVKSFHAVYMDTSSDRLYVDFIVDYSLRDWEKVRDDFNDYMKKLYPDRQIMLTIETEFV